MFPPDTPNTVEYTPNYVPEQLRIAFVHPDLGIGGAERLVVDAAVALQKLGHEVEVFTSFHQDGAGGRSFEETRDGTLRVHVLGGWLVPPSVVGRFTIICAILRQLHLALSLLLSCYLWHFSRLPILSSLLHPLDHPFSSSADWSWRRQTRPFDVIVVDQLSACIPILRWFGSNRVVFYCHFPDQLLAPNRPASHVSNDPRKPPPTTVSGTIRSMYRRPIDALEEATTGEADKIVVNSEFTSDVFVRTFRMLGRIPRVVYPCVDVEAYKAESAIEEADRWLLGDRPTLLSINRFEAKKDVKLAIEAFALAREQHPKLRLIIAGGYDSRLADNVSTLTSLQRLADKHKLAHYSFNASEKVKGDPSPPPTHDVVFLLNMTTSQKTLLLSSSHRSATNVKLLLYTPSFEHFGIVPLEAMASSLPVLATSSGGPVETIIDSGLDNTSTSGLLRSPDKTVWAEALNALLALPETRLAEMGAAGLERVTTTFSRDRLGKDMDKVCRDAVAIGRPVWTEDGFKKMVAFCIIGTVVGWIGVAAYGYGKMKGWK